MSCPTGKLAYASWWQAWRAHRHTVKRGHHRTAKVYRCHCGAWHLGREGRIR